MDRSAEIWDANQILLRCLLGCGHAADAQFGRRLPNPQDDPEQSKRFLEAAKEARADGDSQGAQTKSSRL
jgi:hypothetical protein